MKQPLHMNDRVQRVKGIWIEEALKIERAQMFRILTIRAAISFAVGFVTAMLTPKWWVLPVTLVGYIAFFYLWKAILRLGVIYDIPPKDGNWKKIYKVKS